MISQALVQQAGASDDFQEMVSDERGGLKKKFSMDAVLEDKICDLYDLFVEVYTCSECHALNIFFFFLWKSFSQSFSCFALTFDDSRDWMKIQVHKSESYMWRLCFLFLVHVSLCFHLPNVFLNEMEQLLPHSFLKFY
jgi:hypothetical protein